MSVKSKIINMEQQTAWVKRDGKWSQVQINSKRMKLTKKGTARPALKPKFKPIHIDKSKDLILAFTDGGCHPNGKPVNKAGYAFVLVEHDKVLYEYSKALTNSTNNKCELQAIIDCLEYIEQTIPDTQVLLHSDSQYCIHGICTWRHNWMKKGWRDVKNVEQWQVLSKLVDDNPNVQYKWVRGHQEGDGIEARYNTYVDELCTGMMYGKESKPASRIDWITEMKDASDMLNDIDRTLNGSGRIKLAKKVKVLKDTWANGWLSEEGQKVIGEQVKLAMKRANKPSEAEELLKRVYVAVKTNINGRITEVYPDIEQYLKKNKLIS